MKEEQIEQLLHRYMEATATAAEEEQLRQYFASGTCDAAIIDSLMAAAMVGENTGYAQLTYTVALNSEE